MLWRMAWRNLWRHRTRTVIMASAVGLSYGLFLISMGMNDDGHQQMLDQAVEGAGGDVLVHADGYWDSRSSDLVLEDGDAVLAAVARARSVGAAFPRILIQGLVGSAAGSRPALILGIDPALESGLRDFARDVRLGEYLTESTRRDPILLGSALVEKLELELGDRVVLTATDPQGEVTRALFHLTGVLTTGLKEMDEGMALTTLDAARSALGGSGMLTQIGVRAEAGASPDSVAASVRAELAGRDVEVMTWAEAIPEMVGFIKLDDAFMYIFMLVIFSVVAFAIANTFLMAVMERVREFGLLNALGLRSGGVARLLLAETVLMTALALAAGFALALTAHLALQRWGIPVAAWGLDSAEVSGVDIANMVMRSRLNPLKWSLATLGVALITLGSALYPAWRASRLAPAEAMRFYE